MILSLLIINKIQESYIHFFQKNELVLFHIFSAEFQAIEVCFTGQNSQPLKKEHRINLTLVVK